MHLAKKSNKFYKIITSLIGGGLFCFFVWIIFLATSPSLPSINKPVLFYSNHQQQDLKLTLCSAMTQCQKSLDLQVYSITDPKIITLLKQKREEGLNVSVLYDKKGSGNLKGKLPWAKAASSKGLMHRKMVILDDQIVFLGTANLTPTSLQMHDNLTLGLHHPSLAQFIKDPTADYFSFDLEGSPSEIWMLPSKNGLNRLVQLIDNSKKSLHVAMFTFTHPRLIQALIEAKKRGLAVTLALDFHTSHGASLKAVNTLAQANIPILISRGKQLLHHKWALIDGKTLVVGSANWTKAAFEKNQDVYIIIHSLNKEQKNYIKKIWKILSLESEYFNSEHQ